ITTRIQVTVLDTNVVSELMREHAAAEVLDWAARRAPSNLFTTAISESEIFFGIALLPSGKRRERLERLAADVLASFENRVLPFDSTAARIFGELSALRRKAGRPISAADGQIASIVRSRDAHLATRNVADFSGC